MVICSEFVIGSEYITEIDNAENVSKQGEIFRSKSSKNLC